METKKSNNNLSSERLAKWTVGERVVYPSRGVGEIVSIETNELFGPDKLVYVLELMQATKPRVMIETGKAEKGSLRPVVSHAEAIQIITSLTEPLPSTKKLPWTKLQRILLDKLASPCLQDVADVVRALYQLKSIKDLSFSQRRIFDTAIGLMVQELSLSLNRPLEDVEVEIRAMFA